jgi:hypothetical protein
LYEELELARQVPGGQLHWIKPIAEKVFIHAFVPFGEEFRV